MTAHAPEVLTRPVSMAGIPVHKAAPINTNAAKATGISPPTSQPANPTNRSAPANLPATTTAAAPYPAARPGAAAIPVPTGAPRATNAYATRTTPLAPTQPSDIPPLPQAGAVPSPFIAPATPITHGRRPSIPPPPKAGEIPMPADFYAPHYEQEQETHQSQSQSPYTPQSSRAHPPPQMSAVLSTPTRAIPPASTTSTPATAYNDLSHPPGYIQNSRDSFDERPDLMQQSPYQNNNQNYGKNSSSNRNGLLGSAGGDLDSTEEGSPIAQIWNTATSWAKSAGEKLKEGEEEVWRRINSEK
jgi:hypothetical protein